MAAYFAALDPMTLVRALPGNVAQGIIWGIMALGVYITFRILDFADLTVDGSLATGGAVAVMLIRAGVNPALALIFAFLAGMAAGFVTGVLHTFFGIPGILASILTQIGLYSVNLGIMGKSNQAVNVMQYKLVASLRYVTGEGNWIFFLKLILAALILIALCYWFFGTELGASIRATGCNEQMARAQGINTGFNKVLALMISNGLVGLCGGIYAQYQSRCQYGTWCHCNRTCSRYHQRSYFWKILCRQKSSLCIYTGSNLYRSDYLLYCNRTGIVAEDAF